MAFTMSAIPRAALSAIGLQLATAIEIYEADVEQVLSGHLSMADCQRASSRLDEVVMLKGPLPQLSVQLVELLISHTELMHALWGARPAGDRARSELVARHREAVDAMHARCLRLFGPAADRH
jgi:hypothetical protein